MIRVFHLKRKKKILRVAARMGYSPDPMLSALAAYRTRRRPATFHGTLAWIVNSDFNFNWRNNIHFVDYYKGALLRAKYHGYPKFTARFRDLVVSLYLP
jgi:hypothetical protein